MNLSVKALNPDNDSEVHQLCELYRSGYGDSFQITPVKSERYWKSRAGTRIRTILVKDGAKLVASLSLRSDRGNSSHMQLFLPVFDPAYKEALSEIRSAIADLLARMSKRQQWTMLYCYEFLQLGDQAQFAHDLVSGVDVAIWPSTQQKDSGAKSDFLGLGTAKVSQRMLAEQDERIKSSAGSVNLFLFVPEKHIDACRNVYEGLGIKGVELISAEKQFRAEDVGLSKAALSADRRAIERQCHKRAGFCISFVEPSLTAGARDLLQIINQRGYSSEYVALNMLDPLTPRFADELAANGFGFAGVLPFHRNRQTLLYFKTKGSFDWASVAQSSSLANHLSGQVMRSAKAKKSNRNLHTEP